MSNRPNTLQTEQNVLNDAKNQTYGTLDVTPMVETGVGVALPLGYQAPMPVTAGAGSSTAINDGTTTTDKAKVSDGKSSYGKGLHAITGTYFATRGTLADGQADFLKLDVNGNLAVAVQQNGSVVSDTNPLEVTLVNGEVPAINLGATDNAVLDDIAAKVNSNLDGASTHGTRDLTSANTWYAVPSTVPTAAYILIAQPRTGNAGTVRWSFLNSGTPGAGTGLEIQGNLILRLAANESVFFASTTAGDDVDWTCKEIV